MSTINRRDNCSGCWLAQQYRTWEVKSYQNIKKTSELRRAEKYLYYFWVSRAEKMLEFLLVFDSLALHWLSPSSDVNKLILYIWVVEKNESIRWLRQVTHSLWFRLDCHLTTFFLFSFHRTESTKLNLIDFFFIHFLAKSWALSFKSSHESLSKKIFLVLVSVVCVCHETIGSWKKFIFIVFNFVNWYYDEIVSDFLFYIE